MRKSRLQNPDVLFFFLSFSVFQLPVSGSSSTSGNPLHNFTNFELGSSRNHPLLGSRLSPQSFSRVFVAFSFSSMKCYWERRSVHKTGPSTHSFLLTVSNGRKNGTILSMLTNFVLLIRFCLALGVSRAPLDPLSLFVKFIRSE